MDQLKTQRNRSGEAGFSILEILLAMAIAIISISGVIMATGLSGGGASRNVNGDQVTILAGETNAEALQKAQALLESAQASARSNFDTLASQATTTDGIYKKWTTVTIDPTNPDIKYVTSMVSWSIDSRPLYVQLRTLVANPQGGKCSPTLSGDWTQPVLLGSADVISPTGAQNLFVLSKKAYVAVSPTSGTQDTFYIFDVSDPTLSTLPESSSINTGTGLTDVYVSGNYAYVANTDVDAQLEIIDISSSTAPVLVKTFKVPGVTGGGTQKGFGNSIFFAKKKVYLGLSEVKTGTEFHVIDVSAFLTNPANDPVELGSGYAVGADVNRIFVDKDTAYAATAGPTTNILKLDVGTPSSGIFLLRSFMPADNPKSKMDGLSTILSRDGSTVYVTRTQGFSAATDPEFYALTSSDLTPTASKYLGGDINAVTVRSNLAFLMTSVSSLRFQIWDLNNLSAGSPYGSVSLPANPTGGYDCAGNLVYVGMGSNKALQIVGPRPDYVLSNTGDITVQQGSSGNTVVTRTLLGGYAPGITLSVSGLPAGATASWSNNPCSPTCSSTLTITTTLATPVGNSTITVSPAAGEPTGPSTVPTTFQLHVTLQAFDYSLSTPVDVTLTRAGASQPTSFTATLTSGNTQSVNFSNSALPSGVTMNYSATSCNPTCTTTLTLSASASAALGTNSITITGGSPTHTTSFNVTVNPAPFDYSLSVLPGNITLNPNQSKSETITVQMVPGAVTQSVSLTFSDSKSGVSFSPANPSCAPNPSSCTVTVTVTGAPTIQNGKHTVTVTGTSPTRTTTFTIN